MANVRAKKHLGQHFLTDLGIAQSIADSLSCNQYSTILEVGPGMGILTQFLLQKKKKYRNFCGRNRSGVRQLS
jgi:16S rRNA (adenine1518-N6/adenine1519-N6)-dimethyltransferase